MSQAANEAPEEEVLFWLVYLDIDSLELKYDGYETPQELATKLKNLPWTTVGMIIRGTRAYVTRGPYRWLKVAGLPDIPLFDTPTQGTVDETTSLGYSPEPVAVDSDYLNLMDGLTASNTATELQQAKDEAAQDEAGDGAEDELTE